MAQFNDDKYSALFVLGFRGTIQDREAAFWKSGGLSGGGGGGNPIEPLNKTLPTISGSTSLGSLLTGSTGTWTGNPTPTYSYAWKRSGTAIVGATSPTYTVVEVDQGSNITFSVTASNSAGTVVVTSAPINIPYPVTINPLNTPILFEGDSNTDPGFSQTSWAKTAMLEAGSRYYMPPLGNYAGAGGNVSTISGNSMDFRKATVVSRIQSMVSTYGRCILWFQIGTNGPGTRTNQQSIDDLASIVAMYRNAGAKVYANTCPTYGSTNTDPTDYRNMLNAWIKTTGNVDGFIDVNTVITASDTNDATHYNDSGKDKVGQLVGAKLSSMMVTTPIYNDGATVALSSGFTGTAGTAQNMVVTGPLATGWVLNNIYNKNTVATASIVQLDGANAQRLVVSTTEDTLLSFEFSGPVSVAAGQVSDLMATVQVVAGEGGFLFYGDDGNVSAGFPSFDQPIALPVAYWNRPYVWRANPRSLQTSATTNQKVGVLIDVKANKTVTFDIGKMRVAVRPA